MSEFAVKLQDNFAAPLGADFAARQYADDEDTTCCCDDDTPTTRYYPLLYCEDDTDSGKRFAEDATVGGDAVSDHLSDVYRENTTGFCYTLGALVDDAGVTPGSGKFISTCEECCDCDRTVLPSSLTVTATVTGRGAGGPDFVVLALDAGDCSYGDPVTVANNSVDEVFQAQLIGPGSAFDLGFSDDTSPCGYVLNLLSTVQDDGDPPCEFQMFIPGSPPLGAFSSTNLIAVPGQPCHTPAVSSVSGTIS